MEESLLVEQREMDPLPERWEIPPIPRNFPGINLSLTRGTAQFRDSGRGEEEFGIFPRFSGGLISGQVVAFFN